MKKAKHQNDHHQAHQNVHQYEYLEHVLAFFIIYCIVVYRVSLNYPPPHQTKPLNDLRVFERALAHIVGVI